MRCDVKTPQSCFSIPLSIHLKFFDAIVVSLVKLAVPQISQALFNLEYIKWVVSLLVTHAGSKRDFFVPWIVNWSVAEVRISVYSKIFGGDRNCYGVRCLGSILYTANIKLFIERNIDQNVNFFWI